MPPRTQRGNAASTELALPDSHPSPYTITSALQKRAIYAVSSDASQHLTDFGPNEWLVAELYQKYLHDRNSVDKACWIFFADYKPAEAAGAKGGGAAKKA